MTICKALTFSTMIYIGHESNYKSLNWYTKF